MEVLVDGVWRDGGSVSAKWVVGAGKLCIRWSGSACMAEFYFGRAGRSMGLAVRCARYSTYGYFANHFFLGRRLKGERRGKCAQRYPRRGGGRESYQGRRSPGTKVLSGVTRLLYKYVD